MKSWINQSISMAGVAFAALAAIGYTSANAFKRCLAVTTPPELVVTVKALFTAIVFVPLLVMLYRNEQKKNGQADNVANGANESPTKSRVIPPVSIIALLVLAAFVVQFGGNLAFQISLAYIGMAVSVPLLMSVMVISGALLGKLFLREAITLQMSVAIALFVASIFLLSAGVEAQPHATAAAPANEVIEAHEAFIANTPADQVPNHFEREDRKPAGQANSSQTDQTSGEACVEENSPVWTALESTSRQALASMGGGDREQTGWQITMWGIYAACAAGFSYAVLGLAIRKSMKFGTPSATPMAVVGVIGAIALGSMTFYNHGPGVWAQIDLNQWLCLLGAAVSNTLAFLFLTQAFKLLPITYVNATNLAQIAMAAVIGVCYFGECFCQNIWIGLGLMAVGYLILGMRKFSLAELLSWRDQKA